MAGALVGSYILIGIIYVMILEVGHNVFEKSIKQVFRKRYDSESIIIMFMKGLLQFIFMLNWPITNLMAVLFKMYFNAKRESPT